MSNELKPEICIICDSETDRAGQFDDSFFIGSDGPYCETCYYEELEQRAYAFPTFQQQNIELKKECDTLTTELDKLRAEIEVYKEMVKKVIDVHSSYSYESSKELEAELKRRVEQQ